MTFKTISELKTMARGRMLGNYNIAVSAFILMELMFFLLGRLTNSVVDVNTLTGAVIYYAILLIINLIAAILIAGNLSIYLKIACGRKAQVSDLFSVFAIHPDKAILVQLIIYAGMILAALPATLTGVFYYTAESGDNNAGTGIFIAFLVFVIIGVIACIYIKVITSQALYLMLDFPQYSAKELVKYSREIMKGHFFRYVGMVISFIPLMLLGAVSCGIGLFFVYPYYQMALTEFYLDIIRQPEETTTTFSVAV